MLRWITRALAILVIAVAAFVVLDFAELLVPVEPDDTQSMADTIPACDGRVLAQGLTYRFWDPSPGHVVAVHAAENDDGSVVPDRDADDRVLVLRVAAGPGDVIEGRDGTVFVDDVKFDDIETEPFEPVTVPNEQYFLGDNRSAAIDSRTFGPRSRCDLRSRVRRLLAASDITFRLDPGEGASPGPDRLRLAFAHESGSRRRSSGHSRRGRRDPRGRRDGRRCGRRDGACVVCRGDGDEACSRAATRSRSTARA